MEMHNHVINRETHLRIEQQSHTAIYFKDDGMTTIQGCDQVNVVLAMSAIEDIISTCKQKESTKPSDSAKRTNASLNKSKHDTPSPLSTGGKRCNQGQHTPHKKKHHGVSSGTSGKVRVYAERQETISNTPTMAAQCGSMNNNSLLDSHVPPLSNVYLEHSANQYENLSYPRSIQKQHNYEQPRGYEPLIQHQQYLHPPPTFQPMPPSATFRKRHIIIDGSNVAMAHGNHTFFSCRGIELCVNYFKRKGHTQITTLVPQSRARFPRQDKPIKHQHILEELREQGIIKLYKKKKHLGQCLLMINKIM